MIRLFAPPAAFGCKALTIPPPPGFLPWQWVRLRLLGGRLPFGPFTVTICRVVQRHGTSAPRSSLPFFEPKWAAGSLGQGFLLDLTHARWCDRRVQPCNWPPYAPPPTGGSERSYRSNRNATLSQNGYGHNEKTPNILGKKNSRQRHTIGLTGFFGPWTLDLVTRGNAVP